MQDLRPEPEDLLPGRATALRCCIARQLTIDGWITLGVQSQGWIPLFLSRTLTGACTNCRTCNGPLRHMPDLCPLGIEPGGSPLGSPNVLLLVVVPPPRPPAQSRANSPGELTLEDVVSQQRTKRRPARTEKGAPCKISSF